MKLIDKALKSHLGSYLVFDPEVSEGPISDLIDSLREKGKLQEEVWAVDGKIVPDKKFPRDGVSPGGYQIGEIDGVKFAILGSLRDPSGYYYYSLAVSKSDVSKIEKYL